MLGFVSGDRRAGYSSAVFGIELDGSGLRKLADPGSGPVLSPIGDRIAYDVSGPLGDTHAIWVVQANGTGKVPVTASDKTVALGPAWSPDGRKIAFSAFPFGSYGYTDSMRLREIYITNADGSGTIQITSNGKMNFGPVWSPDGRRIAFTSFIDTCWSCPDEEIYVVDADGSGLTRLTSPYSPAVNPGYLHPRWSPDGTSIACWRSDFGVEHLYVMNADGTGLRQLTDVVPATVPKWSPDGGQILFGSADGRVTVIRADGSGLSQLCPGYVPAWSPDGRMIAFIANSGLYVISADGSDTFRVHQPANTFVEDAQPFWLH
jgi:Tol biopolymer transport system component